jgi:hypothetical protein
MQYQNVSGKFLSWMLCQKVLRANPVDSSAEICFDEIESENYYAAIATGDDPGLLDGLLVYGVVCETVTLAYIYVCKSFRRKGIATAMIEQAMFHSPHTMLVKKIRFVAGTKDGNYLIPYIKSLPFEVEAISCPWGK